MSEAYTVQRGDTLSQIAADNDISLRQLLEQNPQFRSNPDLIHPGDVVRLNGAARQEAAIATTSGAAAPTAEGGAPSGMSLSRSGLDFIKSHEGLRLTAYQDPGAGIWTIGYGHTGPDVRPGMSITRERAEELLRQDTGWAQNAVRQNVRVPLTQGQFDALTSFTYNVGAGAFGSSTLLAKLNAGDYAGAQAEFARWNKGGGQVLPGLVRRRAEEAAMFGNQGPGGGQQPPSPAPGPGGETYVVRRGDTLSGIASRYPGVSWQDIQRANGIDNPNLIHPGQRLTIPGGGSGSPGGTSGSYTVQRGDTLSGIASRYPGVSWRDIQRANGIGNPHLIHPGQRLTIPGGGGGPTPPAPGGPGQSYPPFGVRSGGRSISDPSQASPHHSDAGGRWRQGQLLIPRDVVLQAPGRSTTSTDVPSPVTGTVVTKAYQAGGAGNYVVLRSDQGDLVYLMHFSHVDVQQGQRVTYGQPLGHQGTTGNSTGPHVHIEAKPEIFNRWIHDLLDGRFDGIRT